MLSASSAALRAARFLLEIAPPRWGSSLSLSFFGEKYDTMQNMTWKGEEKRRRSATTTKSLKAIYEWGISFSIKFIWTLRMDFMSFQFHSDDFLSWELLLTFCCCCAKELVGLPQRAEKLNCLYMFVTEHERQCVNQLFLSSPLSLNFLTYQMRVELRHSQFQLQFWRFIRLISPAAAARELTRENFLR